MDRQWRHRTRSRPLAVALAFTMLPWAHVGVASARPAHGRCTPRGRVVFASSELSVSSTSGGRLYSCVRASGEVHRIVHANASAKGFLAAGHYLGFTYTSDGEPYLDVFDALSGSTVLDLGLHGGCGPVNNPCVSSLAGFQLASNGWVAEYSPNGSLTATSGHGSTVELDSGLGLTPTHQRLSNANGVDLSQSTGSTLSWTTDDGSMSYSAPLGPQLAALDSAALEKGAVHPVAALPGACALFTAAEAQAVLGARTQSSSGDSCTYTMSGMPRSTLTVTLQPNLTPAQVLAAKQAAYTQATSPQLIAPWPGPPDYGKYLWVLSWESGDGGASGAQSQTVQILGEDSLTVQLATRPTSDATGYEVGTSQCWRADEVVEHATDIAFDRLLGVPISYHTVATGPSCAKANEEF